ncbi:MAG: hypothetical protein M3Y87_22225 [Myxococcota bacterium]|nr:hypothetical protein [Myxococcota bacterium]
MLRSTSGWLFLGLFLVLGACGSRESTPDQEQTEPESTNGAEAQPPAGEPGEGDPQLERRGEVVIGTDPCTSDADCVPAACCHASTCVAAANAPSCGDAMCTMECRLGTIDCGGGCLCQDGRCGARLMVPPAGLGPTDAPQ